MALMKGKASKALELYEPSEVPDTIPRDRWDRPLIMPLDGGKPMAYTRASTLGKAIEDTYHLSKWLQRSVAFGLSRRPDLVALVAAVKTNEGEDRQPLDELCEKAHEAAKGDQGANVGTALHKLSERRDAGEDLSYLAPILLLALDSYSQWMRYFRILASETFVVCDPLLTAGSFDRVVELLVDLEFHHRKLGQVALPAGTVLVVDLKTGKAESAKYWGPAYGVQQTVYACGQPYQHGVGRIPWEEILNGRTPSTDWALLLHVPGDSPKDAGLVVVDLNEGAAMADLCLEVRAARKNKALLSEAYPVEGRPAVTATAEVVEGEGQALVFQGAAEDQDGVVLEAEIVDIQVSPGMLLDWIAEAPDEDRLTELWERFSDSWNDEHSEAARSRLHDLYSDAPAEAEENTGPAPKPAHVAKLDLIGKLRTAPDGDALNALWETHQAEWTEDATRMVRARLRELEAAG